MLPDRLSELAFGDKASSKATGYDHSAKLNLGKTAISSRYRLGYSNRWSQSASIISGVTVRFRPLQFGEYAEAPEIPQVSTKIYDRNLTTLSLFSYLTSD